MVFLGLRPFSGIPDSRMPDNWHVPFPPPCVLIPNANDWHRELSDMHNSLHTRTEFVSLVRNTFVGGIIACWIIREKHSAMRKREEEKKQSKRLMMMMRRKKKNSEQESNQICNTINFIWWWHNIEMGEALCNCNCHKTDQLNQFSIQAHEMHRMTKSTHSLSLYSANRQQQRRRRHHSFEKK